MQNDWRGRDHWPQGWLSLFVRTLQERLLRAGGPRITCFPEPKNEFLFRFNFTRSTKRIRSNARVLDRVMVDETRSFTRPYDGRDGAVGRLSLNPWSPVKESRCKTSKRRELRPGSGTRQGLREGIGWIFWVDPVLGHAWELAPHSAHVVQSGGYAPIKFQEVWPDQHVERLFLLNALRPQHTALEKTIRQPVHTDRQPYWVYQKLSRSKQEWSWTLCCHLVSKLLMRRTSSSTWSLTTKQRWKYSSQWQRLHVYTHVCVSRCGSHYAPFDCFCCRHLHQGAAASQGQCPRTVLLANASAQQIAQGLRKTHTIDMKHKV